MQTENRWLKEAIAVYYPEDRIERAIQDAFHKYDEGWLPMYSCKLALRGITLLKMFDNSWFDGPLMRQRIEYFFLPQWSESEELFFVTHPLFLRDILENREINSYIYDPIVFVTQPIRHYLLREYPVHIRIDKNKLLSENKDIRFLYMGGMVFVDHENVKLTSDCILDINVVKNKSFVLEVEPDLVLDMQKEVGVKVAQANHGVFHVNEHERAILPSMTVWDKTRRCRGEIDYVEPGETGLVGIRLVDGSIVSIGKLFFDHRFVLV